MTTDPKSEERVASNDQVFPAAEVRDKSEGLLRASKMWWVTLLCLILASWLTYRSLPETGPVITVSFPQGHGLKPGDAIRYRGIEVGQVTNVRLNADLSAVDVEVMLNAGEERLGYEGCRFWIVRPRLSLTEIQGLETAVGAKYIGVSPGGADGQSVGKFEGLAVAPADELNRGGLQVVLRSDDKHGISTGAPVTWRGVKAGRVLSVNLSPDARHVHTTILIDRNYRKLVNGSSKFWVNSGFAVDVGLGGVQLNATSLASILNGGVSFATTAETKLNESIRSGYVFSLKKTADPSWLETNAAVPLVDFDLPETVLVTGEYQSSTFGFSSTSSFSQQGILVVDGKQTRLVTARFPSEAMQSSTLKLSMMPPGKKAIELATQFEEVEAVATDFEGEDSTADASAVKGLVSVLAEGQATIQLSDLEGLKFAEDCLLFRSAVIDGKATPIVQTIDLEQMSFQSGRWILQDDEINFPEWQGAPVLRMSTGQVVGILAIVEGQAQIAGQD